MSAPQMLETPEGRRIAYHLTPGDGPAVVFLGGLRSDMQGTKAVFLEDWAKRTGRTFLRFDYSGHGESSGTFEEGCIGDWYEDAQAALGLIGGPVVLVGSSMGGWVSLLTARESDRVAGLVTIAAAPDFTESMKAVFSEDDHTALKEMGRIERPSDYAEGPYVFTRRLFEDGERRQIFDRPLSLPFPTRFLQGTADTDVLPSVALRLLDHAEGPDIRLTLVKDADHRFSTPECLEMITGAVTDVLSR